MSENWISLTSSAEQGKLIARPRGELGLELEPDDEDAMDVYLLACWSDKQSHIGCCIRTSRDSRGTPGRAELCTTSICHAEREYQRG
jgi:hypothetical protein